MKQPWARGINPLYLIRTPTAVIVIVPDYVIIESHASFHSVMVDKYFFLAFYPLISIGYSLGPAIGPKVFVSGA
jgi:hypothetical protein